MGGASVSAAARHMAARKAAPKRVVKGKKKTKTKGKSKLAFKVSAKRQAHRQESKQLQSISQHNDTSAKSFSITLGKPWYKSKFGTAFKYTETWQVIQTSFESKQSFVELKNIGTRSQLAGLPSNTRSNAATHGISPYEINPYRANGGSIIYPAGAAGTAAANDMFYYKSVIGKTMFLNCTTISVTCKVHWLLCKRDTNFSPAALWAQGLAAEQMGSVLAVSQASTVITTATAGQPDNTFVGQSPFAVKEFRKFWKPIHSESFVLQAGDQRDINFKININKLIKKQAIVDRVTLYMANHTIIPFLIYHGSLVGVSDIPAATKVSEIVYGVAKVGMVTNYTHTYLPVSAENKTPAVQQFEGIVSGVGHVLNETQVTDVDAIALTATE